VVYNLATTYMIRLYAGDTLLNSITSTNTTIPPGTFLDVSFNYMSGVTLPLGDLSIMLSSVGPQIDFDNVRLTATSAATSVSEPGTLAPPRGLRASYCRLPPPLTPQWHSRSLPC